MRLTVSSSRAGRPGRGVVVTTAKSRLNVLGVLISPAECAEAVEQILDAASHRQSLTVSALAVHGLMTGVLDSVHRYRLNQFDLLLPDGQPVRWALGWLHGVSLSDRVRGGTLMTALCARAADAGLPVFLFGGTEDLLATLTTHLAHRFPALQIAGTRSSRFRRLSTEEQEATLRLIRQSGAALTFVGLGCPRQEVWVFEQRERLSMPLVAVGAAFGFLAELVPEAPPLMQRLGFEWLFRLGQEPSRLWRRYLLLNPLYLALLALQLTGVRRFDPDAVRRPARDLRYG